MAWYKVYVSIIRCSLQMAFFLWFVLLGPIVEYVGESKLPYGMVPIMLYNGEITLQTQSGRIQTQILDTHTALYTESLEDMTVEEVCQICDHSVMYNLLSLCYFI